MVFLVHPEDHHVIMDSYHSWALFENGIHPKLKHVLAHFGSKRHPQETKPSPVRVECCQERSFVPKMYLKKCLQSIGLCVHCHSSQFMCDLLHGHRLMVLPDDGLVRVAWIQTYPYVSDWLPWECHYRDPQCWYNLLRDDFLFYQIVQLLVYCHL